MPPQGPTTGSPPPSPQIPEPLIRTTCKEPIIGPIYDWGTLSPQQLDSYLGVNLNSTYAKGVRFFFEDCLKYGVSTRDLFRCRKVNRLFQYYGEKTLREQVTRVWFRNEDLPYPARCTIGDADDHCDSQGAAFRGNHSHDVKPVHIITTNMGTTDVQYDTIFGLLPNLEVAVIQIWRDYIRNGMLNVMRENLICLVDIPINRVERGCRNVFPSLRHIVCNYKTYNFWLAAAREGLLPSIESIKMIRVMDEAADWKPRTIAGTTIEGRGVKQISYWLRYLPKGIKTFTTDYPTINFAELRLSPAMKTIKCLGPIATGELHRQAKGQGTIKRGEFYTNVEKLTLLVPAWDDLEVLKAFPLVNNLTIIPTSWSDRHPYLNFLEVLREKMLGKDEDMICKLETFGFHIRREWQADLLSTLADVFPERLKLTFNLTVFSDITVCIIPSLLAPNVRHLEVTLQVPCYLSMKMIFYFVREWMVYQRRLKTIVFRSDPDIAFCGLRQAKFMEIQPEEEDDDLMMLATQVKEIRVMTPDNLHLLVDQAVGHDVYQISFVSM